MSVRIALRLMAVVLLSTAVTTAARAADNVKVAIDRSMHGPTRLPRSA